jgi:hypothetical protein
MASQNTHTGQLFGGGKESEIPESILELKERILKFLADIGSCEDQPKFLANFLIENVFKSIDNTSAVTFGSS